MFSKKLFCFLLVFSFLGFPSFALHPFYEQNGDCYVMIGEGPVRGVYALNNLTGSQSTVLYDPLDAYGLAAFQKWDGTKSIKDLYTFAGADTDWQTVTAPLERRVVMTSSTKIYKSSEIPEETIHRFHSNPNSSRTGLGNHNDSVCGYKYGGTCYPCNVIPAAVPGKPGYYYVPPGKYYHAYDRTFWARWAYGCWFNYSVEYPKDPPAFKDPCCCQPGHYTWGGWAHWVVAENVMAKNRSLKLYDYNINSKIGPSMIKDVATVQIQVKSTLDKKGECYDGCIGEQNGIPLPGGAIPYLDCVFSSIGMSYLFRREPSSTDYLLLGVDSNSKIIGDPTAGSCLGVSSRDTKSDWVYVLGITQINAWLKAANAPYTINELSDVAVSDQWWQKGGIVYAYDKTQGMVYKFTRDETSTSVAIPDQIYVAEGTAPDAIGTDGFGNLYLIKTELDPIASSSFDPTNVSKYAQIPPTDKPGYKLWRGYWYQNAYKTVYKRDVYSGVIGKLTGRILLGTNIFTKDFSTLTPDKTSTWVWNTPDYLLASGPVQTSYRSELAVINNATPPKVSSDNGGVTDIVGPLIQDTAGNAVFPPSTYKFTENEVYFFEVENPPTFDTNGVNLGSQGIDKDSDGRIGSFPITVKNSTVQYYWKVVQVVDREGKATETVLLDMERDNTPGDSYVLPVILGGGQYWVGVKVKFKYYDYNKLPLGALSDQKETVLTPDYTTSRGEIPPKPTFGADYSWATIKIETFPPPPPIGGTGIIMSGMPLFSGGYNFQPVYDPGKIILPYCDPSNKNPPNPTYVIKEISPVDDPTNSRYTVDWAFKIRDSNYNLATNLDRVAIMTSTVPPNPTDPNLIVTGSLKWLNDLQLTWHSILQRGSETVFDKQIITKGAEIHISDLRQLFPAPSQPQSYTLSVSGSRTYAWQAYISSVRFIGGKLVTVWGTVPKTASVQISVDNCHVIVLDNTPPSLTVANPYKSGEKLPGFFINTKTFYGTTGEKLSETESPPTPNAQNIDFVVADNNPLGNATDSLTYADPFFSSIDPKLKVTHNFNNQVGTFTYSTALVGKIPPTDVSDPKNIPIRFQYTSQPANQTIPDSKYKLIRTVLTSADFDGTKIPYVGASDYNPGFSYLRYQINRDDLTHFSKDSGNNYLPQMEPTYANNSAGYSDLNYGFSCMDSAGLDSSAFSNPFATVGRIVIRDNDRPNLFIKGSEIKNQMVGYAPSNIQSAFRTMWGRFSLPTADTEYLHNGLEIWQGGNITGFNIAVKNKVATVGATICDDNLTPFELEQDVIASFTAVSFDNTGTIATDSFVLLDPTGAQLQDLTTSLKPMIYDRFTVPGIYQIKIRIHDNALDWNGTTSKRNYRELDCTFPVYKTGLDIQVIERGNNRTTK
ncbi:MAG: hypothetical protein HQM08_03785 [Candidatus Riflebacteria bacterium]|nr:hypothetical protein [Candidatus Riflebacteria bacterium]